MNKTTNTTTSFTTSHSELTKCKPKKIWDIWADVNNWPKWDFGLKSSKLLSKFEKGAIILLTPQGSPEPIEIKIQNVEIENSFSDFAELPFGAIRTEHKLKKIDNDEYQVTHAITADILHEHVPFFENEIWKHMKEGLPHAVKQLVKIAESATL